MFINPWTWYIINNEMPEIPPGGPKDILKVFAVWFVISVIYLICSYKLIPLVHEYFPGSWSGPLGMLILSIIYIALLILFLIKVLK